jgi:hypothetical protein
MDQHLLVAMRLIGQLHRICQTMGRTASTLLKERMEGENPLRIQKKEDMNCQWVPGSTQHRSIFSLGRGDRRRAVGVRVEEEVELKVYQYEVRLGLVDVFFLSVH